MTNVELEMLKAAGLTEDDFQPQPNQNKRLKNAEQHIAQLEAENTLLRQENERLRADADYIAMMTGVELEVRNE